MEETYLELPVPVSEIWALLNDYRPMPFDAPTSWAECLRKASRTTRGDVIGELHLKGNAQPDDFERVPTGQSLIVVMLAQGEGFILRWLNEGPSKDAAEILGGLGHPTLVRHGDEGTPIRKGYMTVPDDGHMDF
jgi:hypothetical protein